RLDRFRQAWNLTPAEAAALEASPSMTIIDTAEGPLAYPPAALAALGEAMLAALADWHQREPDLAGPQPAQLRRSLPAAPVPEVVGYVAEQLRREGRVARDGMALRLPTHRARLTDADQKLWRRIAPLLDA